jgi:WD40 repeat protein
MSNGDATVLEVATAKRRAVFRGGHKGAVSALALSGDGELALSGGEDGRVQLWDAQTGEARGLLAGHRGAVRHLAFLPDQNRAVSAGADGSVRSWDLAGPFAPPRTPMPVDPGPLARGEKHRFTGLGGAARGVAFLDGGKKALAGGGFYLRRYDLDAGKELKMFPSNQEPIDCLAVSADGKWAVTGGGSGRVRLWDVEAGQEVKQLPGHTTRVTCLAISADGKKVASGSIYFDNAGQRSGGDVRVWEVETGKQTHRFECRKEVGSVLFSADGKRVLASCYGKALLAWDLDTRTEVASVNGSPTGYERLAYAGPGKLLMAGLRGGLRLWDLENGRQARGFAGLAEAANAVAVSADGTRALLGSGGRVFRGGRFAQGDNALRLWDLTEGKELARWGQPDPVLSVALSPDGKLALSGDSRGSVRLWDLSQLAPVDSTKPPDQPVASGPWTGHKGTIHCVAWAPGGKQILTGGADGTARLWEVSTGKQLRLIEVGQPVRCVAFSHDGAWLAAVGDRRAAVIQDADGKLRRTPNLPPAEKEGEGDADLRALVFTQTEGRVFLALGPEVVLTTFKKGSTFKPVRESRLGAVQSLAISPDGKRLAVGNGIGEIAVWDLEIDALAIAYRPHNGKVTSLAFHPKSRALLSGGADGYVAIKNTTTRKGLAQRFAAHTGAVTSVSFLDGGRCVASSGQDRTVRVLLVGTTKLLPFRLYKGHEAAVHGLACEPGGKRIVSVGEAIKVWDISQPVKP